MQMPTVADYLVSRLAELGVTEFFGVPGDFNFNIVSAVEASNQAQWIGCCNELNAGYAADGYARIKGVGAAVTTMGVGELSAVNAIAGAYAEFVPVFKIVGTLATSMQSSGALVHHTLGTGDYGVYQRMYAEVTVAQAKLTAQNAASEIERLIGVALTQRRPVYLNLPLDVCGQRIGDYVPKFQPLPSDPLLLHEAVSEINAAIKKANRPVVIVDSKIGRFGLQDEVRQLVEKANLPVATLAMGKGVFNEQHPNFIGTYNGKLIAPETSRLVENADLLITLGCMLNDTNSAAFTVQREPGRTINVQEDHVNVRRARYDGVQMGDLLTALVKEVEPHAEAIPQVPPEIAESTESNASAPMTYDYLLARMQTFIQSGDTVMVETGSVAEGSIQLRLPNDVQYQNQGLWMSIGYATPATVGAGLAAPDRRLLLLTGDGSHQLTAQAVGTMHRFGLKPIIILINNDGYTIERYLCDDPMDSFNDIGKWNYSKLPEAFGIGDALVATTRTVGEFGEALNAAEASGKLSYIEVVLEAMDAPEVMRRIRENRDTLYGTNSEEGGKLGRNVTPEGVAACPG
jgi:indolepyruvate decarboxylase